jgi:excisionase family DNA binding protein
MPFGRRPFLFIDIDLTIQQCADLKHVSVKTIRRAITSGDLQAKRLGPRLIRVPASELEKWGSSLQYTGGDAL